MNVHDKTVMRICRKLLCNGDDVQIGSKVESKDRIIKTLKKEFPSAKIK